MLALLAGLVLPGWLGAALILTLPRGATRMRERGEWAWLLGSGWLCGILLLTLWMRILSFSGIAFGILPIAAPLTLVAVAASIWVWRREAGRHALAGNRRASGAESARLPGWQRLLWHAALAWLVFRFALLVTELVMRPLYPWDAWTHWATKAKVWFALKTMVPFVSDAEWLLAKGLVYTDANPHYPATIPLIQVWCATLLARWDDVLVELPWGCFGVSIALVVYGFVARRGLPPLWAMAGTWLVASLPFVGVHVALAGYADLPMACYLTLAVLAGWSWSTRRRPDDLVVALLSVAGCILTKNPGKAWVLVMLPGAMAALLPRHRFRIAIAVLGSAIAGAIVLSRFDVVLFGYNFRLEPDVPWRGLVDAYLLYANWHLLWYGAVAAALLGWRNLLAPELAPLTIVVLGGLLFLSFGFVFTNARVWVEDQSTVNRATLHLAPLLAVWSLLLLHAWTPTPAKESSA